MDELIIDGKTYVSSKRAAAITGYAKDYVGQLCREGRVEARLVGRSWYVYEPSLNRHRFNDQKEPERATPVTENKPPTSEETSDKSNIQAVWEKPIYSNEAVPSIPLYDDMDPIKQEQHTPVETPKEHTVTVEEIENAWQSWFTGSAPEPVLETPLISEEETQYEPMPEAEEVPIHVLKPQEEPKKEFIDIPRKIEHYPVMPVQRPTAAVTPGVYTKKNSIILKAVLIAIMLIAASVSFIGAGFARSINVNEANALSGLRFFEGIEVIKTEVK